MVELASHFRSVLSSVASDPELGSVSLFGYSSPDCVDQHCRNLVLVTSALAPPLPPASSRALIGGSYLLFWLHTSVCVRRSIVCPEVFKRFWVFGEMYCFEALDGDGEALAARFRRAGHRRVEVLDGRVWMSPFEPHGLMDVWVAGMEAHFRCRYVMEA